MNRREFIRLAALAGGTLAGGGLLSAHSEAGGVINVVEGSTISDLKVKSMDYTIRYMTEIVNPPKDGKGVDIWIPLPQSDNEQEITNLTIDSPAAFHINEEPGYGNKMVYLNLTHLKGGERVTLTYRIHRKTTGTINDKGEDIKRHLALTEREKWDENITKFVDDVVGKEKDPFKAGKIIYYKLVDYLTYDREIPGCGQGISAWMFEQKRGKCDDFHALFRTVLIYKGIPVSWEQGIALPYPSAIARTGEFEGDCTGAHCWARFYTGDGNWVPVDISEGNKRKEMRDYFFGTLSPNRFKVSTGRDIELKPSQGGDPLNTFPFAYGESDGVPLIYGHHYRNVIRYEVLNVEV